jgi:hypothetical protein
VPAPHHRHWQLPTRSPCHHHLTVLVSDVYLVPRFYQQYPCQLPHVSGIHFRSIGKSPPASSFSRHVTLLGNPPLSSYSLGVIVAQ